MNTIFDIFHLQVLTLQGFAASFAKAGAKALYLTGRSVVSLEEAKRLVRRLNPRVAVVTKAVDIQQESQIQGLFD